LLNRCKGWGLAPPREHHAISSVCIPELVMVGLSGKGLPYFFAIMTVVLLLRSLPMNLPTWITVSRLLGVPLLLYGLQDPNQLEWRWWMVVIFVVAAGTDWLDGYLARRLNQVTDLGKFLDPLVDKLLVMAPFMMLVQWGRIPAWGVFLILARELTIAGWRVSGDSVTGASLWGKVKTVVQMIAIALLIAPLGSHWQDGATGLFWVSVLLTWVSGGLYLLPRPASAAPPR
jgi:CDP-diacylglycerol---glycerol-3-phosphate 3-phosphatidyltransferase